MVYFLQLESFLMIIEKSASKNIKVDINQMVSNNLEHFIPLYMENNSVPLFLFLSHDNLEHFRDILKYQNFDSDHAKKFISNSSNNHSVPLISDSELHSLLTVVTSDTHLMKNVLFAITMLNSFPNPKV